jgi:hypothetical protein
MEEIDAIDQCDESRLWRAVLAQAFEDATCQNPSAFGGGGGRTSFEDRDIARRWLLSVQDSADRRLIISLAGYDVERVEKRAREILSPVIDAERIAAASHTESDKELKARLALADHLELGGSPNARGWLRKRAPKPAPPQWDSQRLFDFLEQHESVLDTAEVEQGLVECERRAELERMAHRRENARAKRYIETYTSSIAAE